MRILKDNMGKFKKGRIPWNKGLTMDDPRVRKNIESATKTIRKMRREGKKITNSETMKRKYASGELIPPMLGKHHKRESIERMIEKKRGIRVSPKTEIRKGQHLSSKTEFKKGQLPHNKIEFTKEQEKIIIRLFTKELMCVEEIGKKFNCTDRPIYRTLKNNRVEINQGKRMGKKFSGEKNFGYKKLNDRKIIELYDKGFSSKKIGELFSVVGSTIVSRLIKNGINIRKPAFGNVGFLEAEDGHLVKSSPELIIDNWLFNNEIQHCYGKSIADTNYRYDFFIPSANLYIEYWGLQSVESYKKKTEKKIEIYKKLRFNLLSIFPQDNLHLKLAPLLEFSKNQTNLKELKII